jgi:hypothetical protein
MVSPGAPVTHLFPIGLHQAWGLLKMIEQALAEAARSCSQMWTVFQG